jgi:hypothetical protein
MASELDEGTSDGLFFNTVMNFRVPSKTEFLD